MSWGGKVRRKICWKAKQSLPKKTQGQITHNGLVEYFKNFALNFISRISHFTVPHFDLNELELRILWLQKRGGRHESKGRNQDDDCLWRAERAAWHWAVPHTNFAKLNITNGGIRFWQMPLEHLRRRLLDNKWPTYNLRMPGSMICMASSPWNLKKQRILGMRRGPYTKVEKRTQGSLKHIRRVNVVTFSQ